MMIAKWMLRRGMAVLVVSLALARGAYAEIREVVYLKNGSIIKGLILEQMPGQSLKIQTADGSIFVYKMDEVEKIAKEQAPAPAPAPAQTASFGPAVQPSGSARKFLFNVKGGLTFPGKLRYKAESEEIDYSCSTPCRDSDSESGKADITGSFAVQGTAEVRVGRLFSVGVGTGYFSSIEFDESDDNDRDDLGSMMPIFASVRLTTALTPVVSPFVLANAGYALFFPGDNTAVKENSAGEDIDTEGGLFWAVGGGMMFPLPGTSLILSLEGTYSAAACKADRHYEAEDVKIEETLEAVVPRFSLMAGLVF